MTEDEFVPYTGQIAIPRSYYVVIIGKVKDEWAYALYRGTKRVALETIGPELDLHLIVNMIVSSMATPVSPIEVMRAISRPVRNLILGRAKPMPKEAVAVARKEPVAPKIKEEEPSQLKNKWILASRSAHINFAFVLAFLNDNYGDEGLKKFYEFMKQSYIESWKALPNKQFRVVMKVMLETHDALRISHNIINDSENDFESEITVMPPEELYAIREMLPTLPTDFPAIMVKIQIEALSEALGYDTEIDIKEPNKLHVHIKSAI